MNCYTRLPWAVLIGLLVAGTIHCISVGLASSYEWLVGRWIVIEWRADGEPDSRSVLRTLFELDVYYPFKEPPPKSPNQTGFHPISAEFVMLRGNATDGLSVHEDSGFVNVSPKEITLGPPTSCFVFHYIRTNVNNTPHLVLKSPFETLVLRRSAAPLARPRQPGMTMPIGYSDSKAIEDLKGMWSDSTLEREPERRP
ncbi:MAG: hypothetical protein JNN07_10425 [Verrucomicrobiales bacterium]|nr:hypothetical protein [Verrucomicrobiales bacterium]